MSLFKLFDFSTLNARGKMVKSAPMQSLRLDALISVEKLTRKGEGLEKLDEEKVRLRSGRGEARRGDVMVATETRGNSGSFGSL